MLQIIFFSFQWVVITTRLVNFWLNGLVNYFSQFIIARQINCFSAANLTDLQKGKKNNIIWEVVTTRMCSAKNNVQAFRPSDLELY